MEIIFFVFSVVLIQAVIGQGNNFCPKGLNAEDVEFVIGNSCYRVYENDESTVTFDTAARMCSSGKGHLLTIMDNSTQQQLMTKIDLASDSHTVLLGLQKVKGQFLWVTGKKATFTNWDPSSTDGDCAKLKLRMSGLWEKVDCQETDWFSVYVCEYNEQSLNGGRPVIYSMLTVMTMLLAPLLANTVHF